MEIHSLSDDPSFPCFVVTFKHITVMLDCALNTTPCLRFLPLTYVPHARRSQLPEWQGPGDTSKSSDPCAVRTLNRRPFVEAPLHFLSPLVSGFDFGRIDAILVSNVHSLLALPFITEHTDFKGRVLTTEPVLAFGQQLMHNMLQFAQRAQQPRPGMWRTSSAAGPDAMLLRTLYSLQDVTNSLAKAQCLAYNENTQLCGSVRITPTSSGFAIGACNWLVQCGPDKFCYLSASSSALNRHPRALDTPTLTGCDVCIVSSLARYPHIHPGRSLEDLCGHAGGTIRGGGSVLIPCVSSGVIYDLFEPLVSHLASMGLQNTPIYFVSPSAKASLAYSNIFSNWLCPSKADRVYLPEWPFNHETMAQMGQIAVFPDLQGEFKAKFREPCVVFVEHPSLRMGDSVHLLDMWAGDARNSLIVVEPDYSLEELLAPFEPVAMRTVFCPIDPRLTAQEMSGVLKELRPKQVVLSPVYTGSGRDTVVYEEGQVHVVDCAHAVHLRLKESSEDGEMSKQFAESIAPKEIAPGMLAASVSARVDCRDFAYTVDSSESDSAESATRSELYGKITVEALVDTLTQYGIHDVHVEQAADGQRLVLPHHHASILISARHTNISTADPGIRKLLRDAVLAHLTQL
eukprot:m.188369 g.188369  ORF g.188369 m.188369 type:complete len:629 (+) comp21646_c0_seq1:647-2533(+)